MMVIVTYPFQGSPKIEQLVMGMDWAFMIWRGLGQSDPFAAPRNM